MTPELLAKHQIESKRQLERLARASKPFVAETKHVYFHVAKMNHWRNIANELIYDLVHSGLVEAVDSITISTVGDPGDMCIENPKILLMESELPLKAFEFPTLQMVYDRALQEPKSALCYIHTKGVTNPRDREKNDCRREMADFVIWDWKNRIEHLRDICTTGARVCGGGGGWHREHVPAVGHYSGNFWWARGEYIAKLPMPMMLLEKHHNRMWAESWLGQRRDFNRNPEYTNEP